MQSQKAHAHFSECSTRRVETQPADFRIAAQHAAALTGKGGLAAMERGDFKEGAG
jgi:hypothetical protein